MGDWTDMISLLKRKMGISTEMRRGPDTAAERPAGSAAAAKSKRQKRNNAPRRSGTEEDQINGFATNRHGNQPTGLTAHTLGPSRPCLQDRADKEEGEQSAVGVHILNKMPACRAGVKPTVAAGRPRR